MKIKSKLLLLPIILLLPFAICSASLQNKTITAWLAYWDIKNSMQNLRINFFGKIDEIGLFFYALDKDGNIINTCKDQIEYKQTIEIVNGMILNAMPTITNDVTYSKNEKKIKNPQIIHQILSDNALRKKHIQQIMEIIKETKASGVDIDYEELDIADKDIFTQFIKELAALLHDEDKTLSVTVMQKTENHQRSGAGSLDWKEIARYADKMVIMCYGYSSKITKPGPVCPSLWLIDIIKFAKTQIPLDKLCIALPSYGFDWSKEKTNTINYQTAKSLLEKHSVKLNWDNKSSTPYFVYNDGGIKHTVWFENKKSISEKIQIIRKFKIKHIAFWHLGFLDPSFSDPLELFLE
jgi:spore germination protein YaaH